MSTVWQYRARDRDGSLREGRVTADTRDQAAAQIRDSGALPVALEALPAPSDAAGRRWWPEPAIRLDDLILFSRQMYSITKAGVPIIQGLARLSESTPNPRFARILQELVRDLEGGRELSSAFARHVDVFGTLYVSLIQVGEMTGQIDRSFNTMFDYLSRDKVAIDRIKSALRYPLFVIVAIGVAVAVLTLFVIPAFAEVFRSTQLALPWATRAILAVSGFASQYWALILVAGTAGFGLFKRWVRTEAGELAWHRWLLKIPRLGPVLLRAALGRFTRALGVALAAGVPISQALAGVAQASGNAWMATRILAMRIGIERGESMLRTSVQAGVFTPVVLQMITVGEETGQLDEMLLEVADFYDREVEYDIANLSAIIEPVLTIVVGVLVLILALGVFLPMWDLTQLAGRR